VFSLLITNLFIVSAHTRCNASALCGKILATGERISQHRHVAATANGIAVVARRLMLRQTCHYYYRNQKGYYADEPTETSANYYWFWFFCH
jgi:hypothetical protein